MPPRHMLFLLRRANGGVFSRVRRTARTVGSHVRNGGVSDDSGKCAFADASLKRHFFSKTSEGRVRAAETGCAHGACFCVFGRAVGLSPLVNPEPALSGVRGDGFRFFRFGKTWNTGYEA